MALSSPVELAEYIGLTSVRQGLLREWAQFLSHHSLILGPVFTESAPPVDFDIRGLHELKQVGDALRLCNHRETMRPAVAAPAGLQPLNVATQILPDWLKENRRQ